MKSKKINSKKNKSSNFSKLSIFQPNKYKFKKIAVKKNKKPRTLWVRRKKKKAA